MIKALSLGGLSWKELGKRVWAEMQEDDVLGRAAQLSYYFLLALFPLLLFLTSLLGYFAGEDSELRRTLFQYLGAVLPGEASQLVDDTVTDVMQGSGGGKISFGILATLWAASNGMGAISESLNVAYDTKETRTWWRTRLSAVMLTFALAALIMSALVLVLYGHNIAEIVAGKFGLGEAFAVAWKVLQWPIALGFVLLGFALIYYFGPDLRDQDWKWITPGAVLGVLIWLLVSLGFRAYLQFFNSYSATYGSLGAVIILMLWFYFTGAAILIGGEINSEVEHEMALRGAPDAKEKGEKAPDDAGATGGTKQSTPGDDNAGKTSAGGGAGETPGGEAWKPLGGGTTEKSASETDAPGRAATLAPGVGKSRVVKSGGGREIAARGAGASAGQVTRAAAGRTPGAARRFSLGKAVVVLGAWAFSKIRIGRPGKGGR